MSMLIDSYIGTENFNSRPSARGDWTVWRDPYYYIFQFTPLREGRPHARAYIIM